MVSKEARNYVAKEIEQYYDTKKEIANIEKNIIYSEAYKGRDATGNAVTLLVTHKTLNQMRNFVNTFESVYERLTEDKKQCIQLLYWSRKSYNCNGVGLKIGVDGSTVGRWRLSILSEVAERMGLK